ncbi:hypothetical protein [Nocardioides sp. JQ2195]|uniref:hypothetical protein n=1 Tax=Nocardioides sp. JQ2195 TaxID=2592334 RepID=UPI001F100445|nr:hypothetical protein [Nocardioides sp. JQ2195]
MDVEHESAPREPAVDRRGRADLVVLGQVGRPFDAQRLDHARHHHQQRGVRVLGQALGAVEEPVAGKLAEGHPGWRQHPDESGRPTARAGVGVAPAVGGGDDGEG